MKQALIDHVKELDAIGRSGSTSDYIVALHNSAPLLFPVLTRDLYNRMRESDGSTPAFELCDIRDSLHVEIGCLSDKGKIMKVVDRLAAIKEPNHSQMRLMAGLLKTVLDARK